MHWRTFQNNEMNSSWMVMGLLPYRSLQAQQHKLLKKSLNIGLSSLCLGCKTIWQNISITEVATPLLCMDLSWSLTISCSISSYYSQPRNWSYLISIPCGVWWWGRHSSIYEVSHKIPKLEYSRIFGSLHILRRIP